MYTPPGIFSTIVYSQYSIVYQPHNLSSTKKMARLEACTLVVEVFYHKASCFHWLYFDTLLPTDLDWSLDIFDIRQYALLQCLQLHNAAVNCIAVNDVGGYFVSGSADGDIKVNYIM